MKKFLISVFALAIIFVVSGVCQAEPVELRFIWYDDGEEGAVMRDLLDRFEKENPDIKVVMDIVAYKTILEQLPIQVEPGKVLIWRVLPIMQSWPATTLICVHISKIPNILKTISLPHPLMCFVARTTRKHCTVSPCSLL
jgi:hypothetical protein